jgi:hypothetical protein
LLHLDGNIQGVYAEATFSVRGSLLSGACKILYSVLVVISLVRSPVLGADVAKQQRQQIEKALIEEYALEDEQSSVVEYMAQLAHGDTVQPIRIVHTRDLVGKDHVLLVVIDDGGRGLHNDSDDSDDSDDLVIVGLPLSDRVRDLTPENTEPPAQGTLSGATCGSPSPIPQDFYSL